MHAAAEIEDCELAPLLGVLVAELVEMARVGVPLAVDPDEVGVEVVDGLDD